MYLQKLGSHLVHGISAWSIGVVIGLLGLTVVNKQLAAGEVKKAVHRSPQGELDYRLYLPTAAGPAQRLILAIHGCKEDAEHFAKLTRLDEWAERNNFLALYPEQKRSRNSDGCWNWFDPSNQVRNSGEPAMIASLVSKTMKKWKIPATETFVMGLSSGAAIAAILGSCYPDLFSGVMMHSGVQYKAAEFPWEAQTTLLLGSARPPPFTGWQAALCAWGHADRVAAMILHGTEDQRAVPINGEQTLWQFAYLNVYLKPSLLEMLPLVPKRTFRAKGPLHHDYTLRDYAPNGELLLRYISVFRLAHAWSGGADGVPHSDPKGPDATKLALDFFNELSRQKGGNSHEAK